VNYVTSVTKQINVREEELGDDDHDHDHQLSLQCFRNHYEGMHHKWVYLTQAHTEGC
jgi:hypothetical protein